jgi:hypothetical protein
MPILSRVFNTRMRGQSFHSDADREQYVQQCDKQMQACAAWFALHSIPPEKRAALGDLSGAPDIKNSLTIPLQSEVPQVLLGRDSPSARAARGDSTRAFVAALSDLTGKEINTGGEMPHYVYAEQALTGNSKNDILMMDQANSGEGRAMKSLGILVEDAKQISPESSQGVDLTPGRGVLHRQIIPARSAITPLAMLDVNDKFVEYYTSEKLQKALKENQASMQFSAVREVAQREKKVEVVEKRQVVEERQPYVPETQPPAPATPASATSVENQRIEVIQESPPIPEAPAEKSWYERQLDKLGTLMRGNEPPAPEVMPPEKSWFETQLDKLDAIFAGRGGQDHEQHQSPPPANEQNYGYHGLDDYHHEHDRGQPWTERVGTQENSPHVESDGGRNTTWADQHPPHQDHTHHHDDPGHGHTNDNGHGIS